MKGSFCNEKPEKSPVRRTFRRHADGSGRLRQREQRHFQRRFRLWQRLRQRGRQDRLPHPDQIKDSGTINIGVFSDKNPFGYVDENGDYQGYDVYFANRIGEDLGVEVNFVSTEAANRIEYLQTGKVDVILANFTVTPSVPRRWTSLCPI